MAGKTDERLKTEIFKAFPKKARRSSCSHLKPTTKKQIRISGGVSVIKVNTDKRRAVKIPDLTLQNLMNKIKPIAN